MDDNKIVPANRVFQLESHNLDKEVEKTVDVLVDSLNVTEVSEELKLLIKLYISINHMMQGTTLGMRTYGLKYYQTTKEDFSLVPINPRNYKLVLLTATNVILPYLTKRYDYLQSVLSKSKLSGLKFSWLTLDNLIQLTKLVSVMNFLLFLVDGKQLRITDRLFNVIIGLSSNNYYNNMTMNKIQMELLNRETVWRATAEFLSTIIPIINFEKLKNKIYKIISLNKGSISQEKLSDFLTKNITDKCAICNQQPFNPHSIGCKHVFCYYCLYSRHLVDESEGFSCTCCKYKTTDRSLVKRYKTYNV